MLIAPMLILHAMNAITDRLFTRNTRIYDRTLIGDLAYAAAQIRWAQLCTEPVETHDLPRQVPTATLLSLPIESPANMTAKSKP